jgi:5'-3' exonuclease
LIALIDGDIVSYRTAASCEPTRIKPEREPQDVAIMRADELVRRILHETGSDSYKLYIGGEDNFRYKIYPEYKANRSDKPKPTYLQDVRSFLVSEWNAEIVNGIEADDALGIAQDKDGHYQTTENHPEFDTIIASIDKDLLMIPGWHYNFVKGERTFVDEDTGLKNFYQQLIQGDQTDGIFGFDGKARPKIPQFLQPKIDELWALTSEQDMLDFTFDMYTDKDQYVINGQVLFILRQEGEYWLDYLSKHGLKIK